ncbi:MULTISPECIES: hypothetical protein [unclassified Sphingomonas]|uniref:hypothetical protein n=1 Tax=unclassified Sphingomonas TaxID=196159 RepID=UPI000A53F49D|nr:MULTISPECIES: hypothetical protein [unclassified Sphingomonas]
MAKFGRGNPIRYDLRNIHFIDKFRFETRKFEDVRIINGKIRASSRNFLTYWATNVRWTDIDLAGIAIISMNPAGLLRLVGNARRSRAGMRCRQRRTGAHGRIIVDHADAGWMGGRP